LMPKAGKAVIIILILMIAIWNSLQLYAYRSASFNIEFTSFEINYIFLIPSGVALHFTLSVQNPSFIDIYIPQIDGEIYLEGIFVDDFHIDERRVPAGGVITQSLYITVSIEDLPALGQAIFSILDKGYADVRIDGNARLRLSLLPFIEVPYYIPIHFSRSETITL